MGKYRKKPVVIEAIQWRGTNQTEILHFMGYTNAGTNDDGTRFLLINTLEGIMTASQDDWIIKGVDGEFYPCKPDIFEKTYEEVNEI